MFFFIRKENKNEKKTCLYQEIKKYVRIGCIIYDENNKYIQYNFINKIKLKYMLILFLPHENINIVIKKL